MGLVDKRWHWLLTGVSFIPVVGQAASGVDTILYLSEGDYTQAAIAGVGLIPGGVYVKAGAKILSVAKDAKLLTAAVKEAQIVAAGAREAKLAADGLKAARAAQMAVNHAAGKAAEAKVLEELTAKGIDVVNPHIAVQVNGSRRVVDILVRGRKGKLIAIEVKSGNATKTAKQVADDATLASKGGKIIGKNAPEKLRNTSVEKLRTITVRVK